MPRSLRIEFPGAFYHVMARVKMGSDANLDRKKWLSVSFAIHSRLLMDRNHYPTRIPGDSEREGNRTRIGRASHETAIDGPSSNNPCNCKPPRKDFLLSDNPKPRQIAIKPDGEPKKWGQMRS